MASTTGKNRSILAGLVAPVTETPTVERGAPATERLSTRLTGLARVTSGDVKEKTLKLNFWRSGDEFELNENEIRKGTPDDVDYDWVWR